jgi:pimeloyl-ACP methyl ester carboxylesterase
MSNTATAEKLVRTVPQALGLVLLLLSCCALSAQNAPHRIRNIVLVHLVAESDRTINAELERWYAKRAKSHTVEVAGASHVVYISHPKEVSALIEDAASHAQ